LFAGFLLHNMFIGDGRAAFWGAAIFNGPANHILATLEDRPFLIGILPTVLGVLGISLAYVMYVFVPSLPAQLATSFRPIYLFLLNKWYFDELYDAILVKPTLWLARFLWKTGDAGIIDGVPNGLAALTKQGSGMMVKLQTGSIAVYAFTMLIGVVALFSIVLVSLFLVVSK
jgi:NADH-quinone oxidoreductase subunit L